MGRQRWERAKRRRQVDHVERCRLREQRRRQLVAEVVLSAEGPVSHEDVARLTGLPVGYLRWAFPSLDAPDVLTVPAPSRSH